MLVELLSDWRLKMNCFELWTETEDSMPETHKGKTENMKDKRSEWSNWLEKATHMNAEQTHDTMAHVLRRRGSNNGGNVCVDSYTS